MHLIKLEGAIGAAFIGLRSVHVDDPARFIEELKARFPHLLLQAVDARYVAGVCHLNLIVQQAWEAKKRNLLYASRFELDLIIRIACDIQISRALRKVGLKPGFQDIVIIAVGDLQEISSLSTSITALGEPSDSVMNLTYEKEKMLVKDHDVGRDLLNSILYRRNRLSWVLAEKAALLRAR